MPISRIELSGSVDGRMITTTSTVGAGTTIHTAQAGTGNDNYDEIWVWATNTSTANGKLSLLWGSTGDVDLVTQTIPAGSGLVPLVPGLVLQNSLLARFFVESTAIKVGGYVNRITA